MEAKSIFSETKAQFNISLAPKRLKQNMNNKKQRLIKDTKKQLTVIHLIFYHCMLW